MIRQTRPVTAELFRETRENGDGGENHENVNGGNEGHPRKDTSIGANVAKSRTKSMQEMHFLRTVQLVGDPLDVRPER
jgi:hypothetical protein